MNIPTEQINQLSRQLNEQQQRIKQLEKELFSAIRDRELLASDFEHALQQLQLLSIS